MSKNKSMAVDTIHAHLLVKLGRNFEAAEKREVITSVITAFWLSDTLREWQWLTKSKKMRRDGGRWKRKSHKQYIGIVPIKTASKVCQKFTKKKIDNAGQIFVSLIAAIFVIVSGWSAERATYVF